MSEPKVNATAEDVKKHAANMELIAIDFLDNEGNYAKDSKSFKFVRLHFVDGKTFTLTRHEMEIMKDFQFNLRPSMDN